MVQDPEPVREKQELPARKIPTNKLSIYLIKTDIDVPHQLFSESLSPIDLGVRGKLYVTPSHSNKPKWLSNFFGSDSSSVDNIPIFTASARAVLVVEGVKKRNFAICFGYGKHMLNPGAIEQRFGIKTALSVLDPENIRSIDKTSLESVPKHSKEQISQDGDKESFGLNIEQDLVRAITGKTKIAYAALGRSVSGKDALYISSKIDIVNVRKILEQCIERYESGDYKTDFEWIDQIAEIDDAQTRERLNTELVRQLIDGSGQKIWAATPEHIEWSEISGFAYGRYNIDQDTPYEDISLTRIVDFIGKEKLSLERLKSAKVLAISNETDDVLHTWRCFDCIYAEVDADGDTHMITNGRWYKINKDFVERVNKEYQAIPRYAAKLPPYDKALHNNENGYNQKLKDELSGVCFDADNISYGGGYSKIEFCDVYSSDKTIFHVKHYSGSSTLSHLFSQGAVSGELMKNDPEFRKLVNNKLSSSLKITDPSAEYKPDGQRIVYAIITSKKDRFDIPFFSKINARNARRMLDGFGYKVELAGIENITKTDS
ncbi:TIGR04141 family sporadically distributed protein [Candidatus Saccharibacteria bacterium]|nr:TIGR04141 family sporadically distributed protein [Candidatus Saccharibacteria bacterium]